MNLLALIEYLDEELSNGSSMPLTSKKLVDAEKCLDLLSELRISLPDEVLNAERIIGDREKIMDDTEEQCERMLDEAARRASQLVSESSIVKKAQMEAKEIVAAAQHDARDIRTGAAQYAEGIMNELEKKVQALLGEVRQNKGELHAMTEHKRTDR